MTSIFSSLYEILLAVPSVPSEHYEQVNLLLELACESQGVSESAADRSRGCNMYQYETAGRCCAHSRWLAEVTRKSPRR